MLSRIEVVQKIREVLSDRCSEPAKDLQEMGHALVAVGKALDGQSLADARAILQAVTALEGQPTR